MPAAAALRLGRSVRAHLLLGAALGSSAGVLGMVARAELDVAAGAAVALAAVAIFVAAAIARPGLSSRAHDAGARLSRRCAGAG